MDLEQLKALIETATKNYTAQKAENEKLQTKFDELDRKHTDLMAQFDKLREGGDADSVKKLVDQLDEIKSEMSDLRTKQKTPIAAIDEKAQKDAMLSIARKTIGEYLKGKNTGTPADLYKFVESNAAERFKTLNITNADEGGRAVAEVLARDVIEYAREYSPILNYVGRKSEMTRNFRELVLVTYPSVQEGIENVAGTTITETTTQEYKEVKAKEFKVNAKPRITDEAMYGTDIDIYASLIRLLGRELAIYTASQVLYGNGTGKNCRGILSSNRVDITNGTGESFKPTLAADPANARDADFYPVFATGVSGALGTDGVSKVDLVVDICNTLPTEHLNGAQWYMNRKTKGEFEKVRDANDNPIFRMGYMNGVATLMLNGYPVVIDDTLPDIAADSTPIIFGRLDRAFAINDGDINKMLLDPFSVDGCTVVKTDKEYFEMVQQSDAILVVACTTNAGA